MKFSSYSRWMGSVAILPTLFSSKTEPKKLLTRSLTFFTSDSGIVTSSVGRVTTVFLRDCLILVGMLSFCSSFATSFGSGFVASFGPSAFANSFDRSFATFFGPSFATFFWCSLYYRCVLGHLFFNV